MLSALRLSGFGGIEEEAGVIYARLNGHDAEFRAVPAEGEGAWTLILAWPVRLDAAHLAGWNEGHTRAKLDIFQGETRLQMPSAGSVEDLALWSVLCDEMIALCVTFRRGQRARGEGW